MVKGSLLVAVDPGEIKTQPNVALSHDEFEQR